MTLQASHQGRVEIADFMLPKPPGYNPRLLGLAAGATDSSQFPPNIA